MITSGGGGFPGIPLNGVSSILIVIVIVVIGIIIVKNLLDL